MSGVNRHGNVGEIYRLDAGHYGGLSDEQMQEMLKSEHGGLNEVFCCGLRNYGDKKYLQLAHRFRTKKYCVR
jgi:DUF1680 family protein